jgi:putative endonuclease
MNTQSRGRDTEERAWQLLEAQGMRLLERNFRSRRGEIDLVVQDRDSIVFVEVRYRSQNRFGGATESVDRHKQARLIACAQYYLQKNPQAARMPCRFDVISVNGSDGTTDWIKSAFDAG